MGNIWLSAGCAIVNLPYCHRRNYLKERGRGMRVVFLSGWAIAISTAQNAKGKMNYLRWRRVDKMDVHIGKFRVIQVAEFKGEEETRRAKLREELDKEKEKEANR